MSQYFNVEKQVLWNPATEVALLFARSADVMVPLVGVPSGIGPVHSDDYEIDLPVFEAFVDALVRRYLDSGSLSPRSLMEGFVVTAVVMVRRASGDVPALRNEMGPGIAAPLVGYGSPRARVDAGQLEELCAAHSRSMAC